ncbi:hypothetical protein P378_16425 [Desulforamulus profundi]|uniref:Uncharacterized protein n=1 Tax=Desulforamulus profundi TaxID=1383067 RepID=A0A2C6L1X0_9FIRM|nr:hypothetical protein P378_16425 [Desulforamulus profundi]
MIRTRLGVVKEITGNRKGITECLVEMQGETQRAVNYDDLTGPCSRGIR